MGATSSREVLFSSREPGKGGRNPKRNFRSFFKDYRLVRNELCEEVQCGIHDKQADLCHRVPIIQEPSQGIQQEDVRPILPVQEDQVQGSRHDRRPAKLLRVGSFRRDNKVPGSSS